VFVGVSGLSVDDLVAADAEGLYEYEYVDDVFGIFCEEASDVLLLVLKVKMLLLITFGNCSPIKLNIEFKLFGIEFEFEFELELVAVKPFG
jgi:hypothetical protein